MRPSGAAIKAPTIGRSTATGGTTELTSAVCTTTHTPYIRKTKRTAASASEKGMPGTSAVVPSRIT